MQKRNRSFLRIVPQIAQMLDVRCDLASNVGSGPGAKPAVIS